jgi:hypothetical protein
VWLKIVVDSFEERSVGIHHPWQAPAGAGLSRKQTDSVGAGAVERMGGGACAALVALPDEFSLPKRVMSCHPERSEGSARCRREILRCAQHDSLCQPVSRNLPVKGLLPPWPPAAISAATRQAAESARSRPRLESF